MVGLSLSDLQSKDGKQGGGGELKDSLGFMVKIPSQKTNQDIKLLQASIRTGKDYSWMDP